MRRVCAVRVGRCLAYDFGGVVDGYDADPRFPTLHGYDAKGAALSGTSGATMPRITRRGLF